MSGMRSGLVRWSLRVALGAGLCVGGIGLLHMPAGRGLLRTLMGDCPIGAEATPEMIEHSRQVSLARVAGDGAAGARPAVGFELDHTTRAEIEAWASTHGVGCEAEVSALRCRAVPAAAWGGPAVADQMILQLDPASRLVGVQVSLRGDDAAAAAAWMRAMTGALEAAIGAPTEQRGEVSAAWIGGGPMRQALARYSFADYRAEVAATQVSGGDVLVRANYQSIPTG
jgi:hypothetical protein